VNSFVLRNRDEIVETQGTPQKDMKVQVPRIFRDEIIREMTGIVPGRVIQFAFNLSKVGISEWQDWQTRKRIVRSTMTGQMIHDDVKRNLRHLSIMGCISASEYCFTAYIVTSQDSQ
jgi:hypothetical protein